jgi:hypothetical protein
MMVKRFILLFMIGFPSLMLAGSGGSHYSIFGIGDLRYIPGGRNVSMGYAGLGMPGANFINNASPASWARINRTRIEAVMLYEGLRSSDGTKSRYLASGNFGGGQLALPISTDHGFVFVGGFTPYSTSDYNVAMRGSEGGIDYSSVHVGTGSLTRGYLGFSFQPFVDLALGASFNYVFGSSDRSRTFSPANPVTDAGAKIIETTSSRGILISAGALFTGFDRLAKDLRPLSVGLVFTTPGKFTTESETRYDFLNERDTITGSDGSISVPAAFGVGLAYQAGERFILAADYYGQPWSKARFNDVPAAELRDAHRVGIGAERMPSREPGASILDRLSYRLGASYHMTYYHVRQTGIDEWSLTGGLGVPITGDVRLNVGLEYGKRGTTRNALIQDTIFRMIFSLSIGEQWFVRYEEE